MSRTAAQDAFPRASTGAVLWHLLRVAVVWLALAVAGCWAALRLSDVDPWLLWGAALVAAHLAVPAYSLTGFGRRLGRRSAGRGQVVLGWFLVAVLTSAVVLGGGLALHATQPTSPPLADVLLASFYPAPVVAAGLLTLLRLWHLGPIRGAAVSILLIVLMLALMMAATWLVMGAAARLVPAMVTVAVVCLALAVWQATRVPEQRLTSIVDLI